MMPEATETFNDSVLPINAILNVSSHFFKIGGLIPFPSEPKIITVLFFKLNPLICFSDFSSAARILNP